MKSTTAAKKTAAAKPAARTQPQRKLDLVPNPATAAGRAALIDEYGLLDNKLAELKPVSKRHEELRRMFLSWYEKDAADGTFEPAGSDYVLTIGPRAERRAITDMRKIVDLIGLDAFLALVSVPFEKLDAVILPENQAGFVTKSLIGPRQLRVIAKAQITSSQAV